MYIERLLSVERQFLVFIDMKHCWKTATHKAEFAAKNSDATHWMRYFKAKENH